MLNKITFILIFVNIVYSQKNDNFVYLNQLTDSLNKSFYKELAKNAAELYSIDWKILYGIWVVESELDYKAKGDGIKNDKGVFVKGSWRAFGLGQIHLPTAKYHYDKKITKERLLNPIENAYASASILKDYLKIFKNDYKYAIAAYNIGPRRVKPFFIKSKNPINMRYVNKVLFESRKVEK